MELVTLRHTIFYWPRLHFLYVLHATPYDTP